MSMQVDFLIVGSGLTGATIARTLADAGCEVLVLERRSHVGGNVHDHLHASGVRIHTYGPHYFRTNSDEIWSYVNRFAEFFPYQALVQTLVDGKLEQWPISAQYIARESGPEWKPGHDKRPTNFEEACLSVMPQTPYEKFIKGYTEKQWGHAATSLSPKLAQRFEVRRDGDPRFSRHCHQGIPRTGYAEFMRELLRGIPVVLNCDYLAMRQLFKARQLLVFTGAIDEFFSYDMGKLDYRAQSREHVFLPSVDYVQSCGQINNPSPECGAHIRTLEWKHMMPPDQAATVRGTVITRESPYSPQNSDHYEYPFPDQRNQFLYDAYRSRAAREKRLMICGRLGEYRYFDMDQAIGRALRIGRKILRSMPLRFRAASMSARTHVDLLNTAGELLLNGKSTEPNPETAA
jgi:UDP-galactopyranose mutase